MQEGNTIPTVGTAKEELKWSSREQSLQALDSLRDDQCLIVDFDQTLFLCNSSQEYIRMAKPYLFGSVIYKLLELLRPWAWFSRGKDSILTRDWFHVWAVTIFFPWTWFVWRSKARKMAEVWTNEDLAKVLRSRDSSYNFLSSQGFGPIVRPVLKHMGISFHKVDTCRLLFGFSDRKISKVERARRMTGETALRQSAVITDSEEDRELLEYVEVPLLITWAAAPVRFVTSRYIPFYYLFKVKHEGLAPILRDIIFVDLILLFLAFSWISPHPFVHAFGISCFFASFLLIYEIGYMENDEVAFEIERDPVISQNFEEKRDFINHVEPWFWATIMALVGASVFAMIDLLSAAGIMAKSYFSNLETIGGFLGDIFPKNISFSLFLIWMLVLLSQRIVFRLYNYADKMTRAWINPFLQSFKSVAFMLISPVNLVGATALFCQVGSRSFGYFLYRWSRKKDWPGSEVSLMRFLMFVSILLVVGHGPGRGYSEFFTLQSLMLTLWVASRAIKPMLLILRKAKHVKHDTWKKISSPTK